MSLFECFGPFSRRRRREALSPRARRRLRRSLRSKASSRDTISLPFSDGPISSGAFSESSWVHSTAAATIDHGGENARSSPPISKIAPHASPPTNTPSIDPLDAGYPRHTLKTTSSHTSTSPPASPSSSCGGSATFRTGLRAPAAAAFPAFAPPSHPPEPLDRGNPRVPYTPSHPRSNSAGSTSVSMERGAQASLSLHSITDDSTKTATTRYPAFAYDHGPVTPGLRQAPVGFPSSFSSQQGGVIFSPASSLCESPTHHASFQSWLQTGSVRSSGSEPAAARLRALSLAAETNLSSDFSVHLYVDPPRSARSTAILAACSNAAYAKVAHLPGSRSNQVVDYFGILPTTVEEEVEVEDTASILDGGMATGTSLRTSPDASSIALDTAGGHTAAAAAAATRPTSASDSSLADVSADVIVDVCATATTGDLSREIGRAGAAARDDFMSTIGTVNEAPTVEGSRLAAASFPGTVSSLHSTASGSLMGMLAACMPQPGARVGGPDLLDVNASAPLWEDPVAEASGVLGFSGAFGDADAVGDDGDGGRGGAIADSAGIPLPSASIAAYSSGEFAAMLRAHSTGSMEHGTHDASEARLDGRGGGAAAAPADDATAAPQFLLSKEETVRQLQPDEACAACFGSPSSAESGAGGARCILEASTTDTRPLLPRIGPSSTSPASHSPADSTKRHPQSARAAAAEAPPSPGLAYSRSEVFLPAGLKPYRVGPRKQAQHHAHSRGTPLLRPTYSISSIPTTPPVASLGSEEFSGSISCPASRAPSRAPSAPASHAEAAAPASCDSVCSMPQPYSIGSSIMPISSDASTILPASTLCPTSFGSTMHPGSVESSLAPTSIAPASTVAASSSLAPTSIASTNPRTSCDITGSRGRPNLLRLPSSGGSGGGGVPLHGLAAAHRRYLSLGSSFASKKSPRLRHYPDSRPTRLRPSPRQLKSGTHSATLTLFPTSSGSLPRPLPPSLSPRNFTADIVLKPHDMQPSTLSTQHSSGVPSLDAILDTVAPPPTFGVIELSTAAELSTVDELSTLPDTHEFGGHSPACSADVAALGEYADTSGCLSASRAEVDTTGVLDGTAELETTSELDTSSHVPGDVIGVGEENALDEQAEEDDREEAEEEEDVLELPGLPSSMSSVHSAVLSPSLQRRKRLVEQLMTTGSSYATAESAAWGTPRSRHSRHSRSHSSNSGGSGGGSAPLLRPLAGPAQRHVFRGNRIDVRALLEGNPCAAAAAAAAAVKPGTLAPPETAVQATHERVLPHVPLAHEAQPRGAHFGVLPARRLPPDSVGSTLSTASVMRPGSRGLESSANIGSESLPPQISPAYDMGSVGGRRSPGWR